MAAVLMRSVFRPGTKVELVRRVATDLHVAGDVVASGVVDEQSVLFIDELEPGGYWAVTEDHGSVQVRAKDGVEAPAGASAKPKRAAKAGRSIEPPARRERVRGARTTANAKPKPKASPVAKAKAKLTGKDEGAA